MSWVPLGRAVWVGRGSAVHSVRPSAASTHGKKHKGLGGNRNDAERLFRESAEHKARVAALIAKYEERLR